MATANGSPVSTVDARRHLSGRRLVALDTGQIEHAAPESRVVTPERTSASYRVVYEDEVVLVVDKAAGVLTVTHPGTRERCLLDDLRRDRYRVAPVHRLDRDTSGLLVLSLDPDHRRDLEDAFRKRRVKKSYLALVRGRPDPVRATIDVPILDQGATARVDRSGRRAVTHYEVLEVLPGSLGGAALVRARPETGRHNQIRVHMAHLGHPLLGDDKFGRRPRAGAAAGPSAARAMLHAEQLSLPHPDGRMLDLHSDPPPDFAQLLASLRRSG